MSWQHRNCSSSGAAAGASAARCLPGVPRGMAQFETPTEAARSTLVGCVVDTVTRGIADAPATAQSNENLFGGDFRDDIACRAELGELWRCELRVLLQHLTYTDRVRLYWNGEEIAADTWRKADWTYQLRPRPDYAVNAYRLHVDLKQLRHLPRTGVNRLGVELLEKDAQLIHSVTLADIALVVEYLPHRNALRDEEQYFA